MSEEKRRPELPEDEDELEAAEAAREDTTEDEDEERERTFTQAELDRILTQRLARERNRTRKELAQMFGTDDLRRVVDTYQAGHAVVTASGVTPGEVVARVRQQHPQLAAAGRMAAPAGGDIRQELGQIRELLSLDREEKARQVQDAEASKQFGNLYTQRRDEITQLAEERGLSLTEAAAIALTPQLKTHLETQARQQQEARRRKRVESSAEGGSVGDEEVASQLTTKERNVAAQFGMSLAEYHKQKQLTSRVTDEA